jgi:hypothetical protein
MSWLEVDDDQPRPTDDAVDGLWGAITIRHIEDVPPDVERYLEELRRVFVNGSAVFARFEVTGTPEFDRFATRGRWQELGFPKRLLLHPAVQTALPELTTDTQVESGVFEWMSALTLDGELAQTLVFGGAYERFMRPAREAKDLGRRVCDALFGDRFGEVEVFRSWKAWSAWFFDVACDVTWVIVDRRHQVVSLIAGTDTD